MMLWQFSDCVDGWNEMQGGEDKPESMSDERFDEEVRKAGYG